MRKIVYIAAMLFFFFVIYNLSQSIYSLWQKQDLLTNANEELKKEKNDNSQLKQQIASVRSSAYIEEEARDKLLLVKPGEQIVVLPNSLIVRDKQPQQEKKILQANWEQWVSLFLHK